MKHVEQDLKPDEIYRQIYDGLIGVKQFENWLNHQLRKAYDQGLIDSDSPPDYNDVSRSQYD